MAQTIPLSTHNIHFDGYLRKNKSAYSSYLKLWITGIISMGNNSADKELWPPLTISTLLANSADYTGDIPLHRPRH